MSRPRVGVLDLGRVAKGLGLDERILEDDETRRQEAEIELKALQIEFKALKEQQETRNAAAETEAQKQAVQDEFARTARELRSRSVDVRRRLVRHRNEVARTFRKRLQPAILDVAQRRRLWVLLDSRAPLFYVTRQVDMTDAVVEAARPIFQGITNLVDTAVDEAAGAQDDGGGGEEPGDA
jgi:Skp family chaperone for outer membrane proteins